MKKLIVCFVGMFLGACSEMTDPVAVAPRPPDPPKFEGQWVGVYFYDTLYVDFIENNKKIDGAGYTVITGWKFPVTAYGVHNHPKMSLIFNIHYYGGYAFSGECQDDSTIVGIKDGNPDYVVTFRKRAHR